MSVGLVRGDQVEMLNGDRYVGHVVSLGSDTLVIQSEFLGALKLPRTRIATISLEPHNLGGDTNTIRSAQSLARTNTAPKRTQAAQSTVTNQFDTVMRQLGANSNVISQVERQFLAGAGPQAQAKFNDLLGGLLSGRLGVNELRTEAKSTLEQARSARKELGEEGGSSLDSYLAILENFLKETEPTVEPTNSTTSAISAKPKAEKPNEE
jgi:hypothetical protein